jgi:hypothetical protein
MQREREREEGVHVCVRARARVRACVRHPLLLPGILQNLHLHFMMPPHVLQSGSFRSKIYSLFIGATACVIPATNSVVTQKGNVC